MARMDPDGDGYVDEREFQGFMMASGGGMMGRTMIGDTDFLYFHLFHLKVSSTRGSRVAAIWKIAVRRSKGSPSLTLSSSCSE